MSARDRATWNKRYLDLINASFPRPDLLLMDYAPPAAAPDARALDLAGGRGQNGLWLAEQGYVVDIMDISRVALDSAREEMTRRGLRRVNLLDVDLDTMHLPTQTYDIVSVFRFFNRRLLPAIGRSINPGGRLIYEAFSLHILDERPNMNPDFCVQGDELADAFSKWKIVLHSTEGVLARLVAIKPTSA
ncbi:MAG: class I SAM-dependent methyltransferase [Chloroflexi bacterium]|jgi:SAM-dependent methyltransferase|nr:MAG: putative methyltransferase [Chloroflexi bacterium OLB13]MBC6957523.1 class I SAM-dependent methyltransferase [Chloroflexota bacterium]MBV6437103.1 hypothetical protein [Anaerolineae bacterium]MDL1916964.1 class I SAM-dependent methyltransferase [Anaerolineae bacterium CFX4]OQY83189.1 MAG: hypothetical protein B6D42_08085 [Anaerolineae bacterium UTCFX5]